jgi:hypothetical protein
MLAVEIDKLKACDEVDEGLGRFKRAMANMVHKQLEESEDTLFGVLKGIIGLFDLNEKSYFGRLGKNREKPGTALNINFNSVGIHEGLVTGHLVKSDHLVTCKQVHNVLCASDRTEIRKVHPNWDITHVKKTCVTAQLITPLIAVCMLMAEEPMSALDSGERRAE